MTIPQRTVDDAQLCISRPIANLDPDSTGLASPDPLSCSVW